MAFSLEFMKQIAAPSKLEVLRILYDAKCGLRLRSIAELANVSLRPIQLAIQSLERDAFIRREHRGSVVLYKLIDLPIPLEKFFLSIQETRMQHTQKMNLKDSHSLGPFQEDAFKMIRARKN